MHTHAFNMRECRRNRMALLLVLTGATLERGRTGRPAQAVAARAELGHQLAQVPLQAGLPLGVRAARLGAQKPGRLRTRQSLRGA